MGSLNSNIYHVSGVSGASSMEGSRRDISVSEVKIEDPFMKTTDDEAEDEGPETATSKTTKFDTGSDESLTN